MVPDELNVPLFVAVSAMISPELVMSSALVMVLAFNVPLFIKLPLLTAFSDVILPEFLISPLLLSASAAISFVLMTVP